MTENLLEQNLVLEEKKEKAKKQWFKNWKFYASAAIATIVISSGLGLGLGLGLQHHSQNEEIIRDLNDLNLDTSIAIVPKNENDAFDNFLIKNSSFTDLKDNVEPGKFTLNYGDNITTLVINAKANSIYSGSIIVNFPGTPQSNINNGFLNTTIQGEGIATETEAFQAFLKINASWTNLSDFVEIQENSLILPTHENNGSITINAKANTAYKGSVKVTISKLK